MSYISTEWKTGDIVSSAGLNKIENRIEEMIGEHILLVNVTQDGYIDKSYNEILAAVASRKKVVMMKHLYAELDSSAYSFIPVRTVMKQPTTGSVAVTTNNSNVKFTIGIDGRLKLVEEGNNLTPE